MNVRPFGTISENNNFSLDWMVFCIGLSAPVLVFRDRSLIAGGWAAFVLERLL
jgi:hypothetical protein